MSELVGQNLGKYRIVARLGAGGMAEVYKAYQPGLDRHVAIKIMQSHVAAQKGSASRFEREAVAVARLRHPNIVQVHDFDAYGDLRYMVMEFIDGPTLRTEFAERRHKNSPFTLAEIARIFAALTNAVDYAHAQGIIHHDLKPDNVMITPAGQVVLTDFGIARLLDSQQTAADVVAGTAAYMAPEQAQGELSDKRSDIYSLGVILYELTAGQVPFKGKPLSVIAQHIKESPPPPTQFNAAVPEPIEQLILKALNKKPVDRYQTAGELGTALWLAADTALEQDPAETSINAVAAAPQFNEIALTPDRAPLSTSAPIPSCPYRGLFAFKEEDAPFFFGREAFAAQLVEAVHQQPLVAVLGPSGSGKSSVVQAGLLPRLRKEATSPPTDLGPINWLVATFRPGESPFQALAAALIEFLQPDLSEADRLVEVSNLANALSSGQTMLPDVVARIIEKNWQQEADTRLLLVIDQFEELYTLCPEPQTRHRFVDHLLATADAGRNYRGLLSRPPFDLYHLPVSIVLTMRADFLAQALTHRRFADALQAADVKLGPMTRQEMERAVENPAGRQGVLFEKGLAARILDDVGEEPGRLPLLEFALTSLWDKQQRGLLTHEAYEASGKVEGALANYAEEVYAKLSPAQQTQARRLFVQLVRPGQGTEDTRRLANRAELGEANWALAQKLADARLVVTGRDAAGQETAEVVHEALIRGWERLRNWMNADRTFRAWQERLRLALQQWETSGRDEGALLRGVLLAEAEGWLAERKNDLSAAEQEFIQASIAQRQQRQAAQEQQRRRIMLGLGAGLVVAVILLCFSVAAAGWAGLNWNRAAQAEAEAKAEAERADAEAERAEAAATEAEAAAVEAEAQRQTAEEQRRTALARSVALATSQTIDQPDLALLLSLEAGQIDPGLQIEVQRSLLTALEANSHLITYLRGHLGDVESVAFSPAGKILAAGVDGDDSIMLWDVETYQPLGPPLIGHTDYVDSIAFSPNGELLASAGGDETIILWDVETGQPVGQPLERHTAYIDSLAFSPDGELLASAGADSKIILWDPTSGQPVGLPLTGHNSTIHRIAFSPTSATLASADDEGLIILWNLDTRQQLGQLQGHNVSIFGLAFSPDGQTLASSDRDGKIILWNLSTRPYQQRGQPLTGHTNSVLSLAFSPDGQILASSSWDRAIILWDVEQRRQLDRLDGHAGAVQEVVFSPDGQMLASAGDDDTAILWDVTVRHRLADPVSEQSGDVMAVAFSPTAAAGAGGNILASGSDDKTIILWNIDTQQPLGPPLTGHTDWVTSLAFNPNGELLASGSRDHTVILWDVAAGRRLDVLTGHEDGVWSVAFSPNGQTLASTGSDQTIILWDVDQRREITRLSGHADKVWTLAFSPDGQLLASGSEDGAIILWDVATGQPLGESLTGHTDSVYSLAFSPAGQTLASGSRDNTVIFWDVSTPSDPSLLGRPLTDHTNSVLNLKFSPIGQTLASSGWDQTIILWDVATRRPIESLVGHAGPVNSLSFTPDGRTLASGGREGAIMVWDVASGNPKFEKPLTGHRRSVLSVAHSPTDSIIAWGSDDQTITLWDLAAGERLGQPLTGHTDWVNSVAFSPNGELLASGSGDQSIRLWDVARGQAVGEPLTGHTAPVSSLAFSPNGELLASGSDDQTVIVWEVDAGAQRHQLKGHDHWVRSVVFNPDGELLASASNDNTIILWSVKNGRQQAVLAGHREPVISLAFSPDGAILASGSEDITIILWDVATGLPLGAPLAGHTSWVSSLAFSPDGGILASAGGDNRIILWDVASSQRLGSLVGHTAELETITFSPDGRRLISGGKDGAILSWDLDLDSWQTRICRVASRNLTWEEWQQYLGDEPYRPTCPDTPLYLAEIYRQADIYARAGQLELARNSFQQAAEAAVSIDAPGLSNNVCWFGSLDGLAEVVLPACDHAVEIGAEESVGLYHDSRGLARAMTGNIEGAIADFEAFMQWSRRYGNYDNLRLKRHAWINALQEGQNPFDETTLAALRIE